MSRWIYSLSVKGDRDTTGDYVSFETRSDGIQVFVRQNGEALMPFTIPAGEFSRMLETIAGREETTMRS